MAISRRGFLIGAAATVGVAAVGVAGGGVLVEQGVLPGKSKLDEALGRCGTALAPPDVETGPVVRGHFTSAARNGADVGWTVVYPPGAAPGDPLRVCLFLPGRGGHHTDVDGPMELDRFLAGAVEDGTVEPFAFASVDGGDAVNWHRRADGDDPVAMIAEEFLPMLEQQGLVVAQPAFWGVSLGGTGALYLATVPDLAPAAVVAASPALWKAPGEWQDGRLRRRGRLRRPQPLEPPGPAHRRRPPHRLWRVRPVRRPCARVPRQPRPGARRRHRAGLPRRAVLESSDPRRARLRRHRAGVTPHRRLTRRPPSPRSWLTRWRIPHPGEPPWVAGRG